MVLSLSKKLSKRMSLEESIKLPWVISLREADPVADQLVELVPVADPAGVG